MDSSSPQNEVDGAGTTANLPGGQKVEPGIEPKAGPIAEPQVGPVNEPKVGPITEPEIKSQAGSIEPATKPEIGQMSEPRMKSSGAKKNRKLVGILAVVAIVVVAGVAGIVTLTTRCNNPSSPETVVSCMPKNVSHEEQVRYLQSKITDATFNLSANEIPEVIAIYEEYFGLLNMQEFPEIYQGCVGDIMKRDFDKEYKSKVVAYTEQYDEILQTPDSAGQAYNNFIYYDDTKLMDKYYNLVRERQIEMGIDPNEEGIG